MLGLYLGSSTAAAFSIPQALFAIAGITASKDLADKDANYYVPLSPIPLQGKNFSLVGVRHNAQTFFQNQKDIKTRVEKTPYVFLEYFDDDMRKLSLPNIGDDQLFNSHGKYNDSVNSFFGGIGRICAQVGRDIIVVNPETAASQLIESYLLFGLPIGITYSKLDNLIADTITNTRKPMSRRTFLKMMLYLPSAYIFASWAGATKKMRNTLEDLGVINSDLSEQEKANLLGWNLIDWRDLSSVKGVVKTRELYGNEWADGQEAVMFQGAGHDGMVEYLRNTSLMERKSNFYIQHNITGERTVRRYTYDKSNNDWNLIKRLPY